MRGLSADYSRDFGSFDVARLFKVVPSTVESWAIRGKLPHHRALNGRRRYKAEDLIAFARKYRYKEDTLDQPLWKRVLTMARSPGIPSAVGQPVLLVDAEGNITGCSQDTWKLLGFDKEDLVAGHVDLKLDIRDPDYGVPLPFKELDRATYEPIRARWSSLNKEDVGGLLWITPLRMGDEDIGGWALSLDAPTSA